MVGQDPCPPPPPPPPLWICAWAQIEKICQLITFANLLDPDQDRPKSDVTLIVLDLTEFFDRVNFEKKVELAVDVNINYKKHEKSPKMQRIITVFLYNNLLTMVSVILFGHF